MNKTTQEVSHKNGWRREWTNNLSGTLGGWNIQPWDKYFPGDFDGDGIDEVLAVGSAGLATDWYSLLKFEGGQWSWLWSNYGNGGVLRSYNANFVVGDFDGDGKDELLGNDTWTTLFKWNGMDWDWTWSDNRSAGHPIHPFKDRLYAGDFDGNGTDELLGCDLPNGWTTIFQYSGSNWIWGYWSDMGTTSMIKPYRSKMVVGDFNGDGKDDVLGINTWATLFDFSNGIWNWLWSNQGSNSFNGWNYPLNPNYDKIIVGNLDPNNKNELMFISTGPYASWAQCQDFNSMLPGWNFNWVANDTYSIPFIDDWPINDGTGYSTNYFPIRTNPTAPERLLALRKFPCGENGRYLASLYEPIGTQKNLAYNNSSNDVIDSVDIKSDSDILIYPNPISNANELTIISRENPMDGYEIVDMLGHVVGSLTFPVPVREASVTGLERLTSGIYSIRIRFSNGRVSLDKLIYGP